MDIGEKIRFYREQFNYSQKELADLVFLSERVLGHYETGSRSPSVDILKNISSAL